MEIGKCQISDIIEHASELQHPHFLKRKNYRFIVEIEPGLPDIVCDNDRLIQVLINLLSNAVKFTEKGSVLCRATKTNNDIQVSVIDTGIGICRIE